MTKVATSTQTKALRKYTVAIVGVPNTGKSVIFNKLTGGRAWVGNWPGVTVEKKTGRLYLKDIDAEVEVVDLPGIYSLTTYRIDEIIARNYIIDGKPDVVVVIANAANLERSLYLILSIMELEANMVVVLNMIDIAKSEGYEVMHSRLSEILGVPVIPAIAISNVGIDALKKEIIKAIRRTRKPRMISYGGSIEKVINEVIDILKKYVPELARKYPLRWVAIKLLEGDDDVIRRVKEFSGGVEALRKVNEIKRDAERKLGDLETLITEERFKRAVEIARLVTKYVEITSRVDITDILDSILTHKVLGIPLALSIIYILFRFAFDLSVPFSDAIDILVNDLLHGWVLTLKFLPDWLTSLLANGVIAGVGAVLVFLPVITFFFLGLAILEDVGYLARLAFVIDKIFHKFRLPGKVIIPMMVGFGCNVPAVMATRAIEDDNDRKVAALIAPLSSCSARLPVYLVIAGAVMGTYAGAAIASMYWLGIMLALLVGLFFRKVVFRGPTTGFIMELPPYLTPRLDNIAIKTWERTKHFLAKAGTVIFVGVVIIWLLSVTGPKGYLGPEALENPELLSSSWIGIIGKAFSVITAPLGWDWRVSAALVFGFVAKEIVVGTMGVLFGAGEETLRRVLSQVFTPITGLAYMAFVLIYVPCIATLAMIRSELGMKYALIAILYEVSLAYLTALSITYIGNLIVGR